MEFLRVVRRRSVLSETIYILLNIALAVTTFGLVWATGSPWLALALVLLSKWRVLAVRPRYWFAHIEANMVDVIVNVSVVMLLYLANQLGGAHAFVVGLAITLLYSIWLLLLKPRTKRSIVVAQAGVAIAVGTMTLASISYEWPSFLVVISMWVIGYSAARHVLVAYSDEDIRLLSLIWGFVVAELGWLTYHWTIAYTLPFGGGLKLPQVTLIVLGFSFLAERVYNSYHKHGAIRMGDLMLPLLLTIGIIIILLTAFGSATIGTA